MSTRKLRHKWWVDFRYKDVRYRKKSPDNTREGARAYEAVLRARLGRGDSIDAENIPQVDKTFGEFAKEWFATYVLANNKPSEQRNKEWALSHYLLPALAEVRLRQISGRDIEAVKARMLAHGLSAKSINNHLAVLNRCLGSAVEWGALQFVPRIAPLKCATPAVSFLTDEEATTLLCERTDDLAHGMILVALRTGVRFGELCALEWSSIDFERRQLTVSRSVVQGVVGTPKSNKTRYIPMTNDLVDQLRGWPRLGPLVFSLDGSSHLTERRCRGMLRRTCRRAGVRFIGWHTLRHTFATQLVSRGVPMRVVQRYLGHSTVVMTERYAHLAPDVLESAIHVLDSQTPVRRFGQPVGNDQYLNGIEIKRSPVNTGDFLER